MVEEEKEGKQAHILLSPPSDVVLNLPSLHPPYSLHSSSSSLPSCLTFTRTSRYAAHYPVNISGDWQISGVFIFIVFVALRQPPPLKEI